MVGPRPRCVAPALPPRSNMSAAASSLTGVVAAVRWSPRHRTTRLSHSAGDRAAQRAAPSSSCTCKRRRASCTATAMSSSGDGAGLAGSSSVDDERREKHIASAVRFAAADDYSAAAEALAAVGAAQARPGLESTTRFFKVRL